MKGIIAWAFALGLASTVAATAMAGPAVDPKQMSGLSRPDAEVPAGEITVRVLDGGFENPVLDHEVMLWVVDASGRKAERRTTKTGNQGRASFADLAAFVGGVALAEVILDGEVVRSRPIEIAADVGLRVMLVKGAAPAPLAPIPGVPFPFTEAPKDGLVVGTFDVENKKPTANMAVKLKITPPGGTTVERTATTDATGKVVFENLVPPEVPADAELVVEAQLEEGKDPHRSAPFSPRPGTGTGVVLVRGSLGTPPDPHAAAEPTPPRPRAGVAGPRQDATVPQGSVLIRLVDGSGRPVADQPLQVIRRDASQTSEEFGGTTDARGLAQIDDITIDSDSLYQVATTYSTAPYTSSFFELDRKTGVAVDLMVFETTSDPSTVRSILHFEVFEAENDYAFVRRNYEVVVDGDKAFWPAKPLHIEVQEGGESLGVEPQSEGWLQHEDPAPFAELVRPIPPGVRIPLTVHYSIAHDGDLTVQWTPPFAPGQVIAFVSDELTLTATGATAITEQVGEGYQAWNLGPRALGVTAKFSISGLKIRTRVFRIVAIVGGVLMFLALGVGLVLRPMVSTRIALEQRRDRLLDLLRTQAPSGRRHERIVTALDRVFRQLDALPAEGPASGSAR